MTHLWSVTGGVDLLGADSWFQQEIYTFRKKSVTIRSLHPPNPIGQKTIGANREWTEWSGQSLVIDDYPPQTLQFVFECVHSSKLNRMSGTRSFRAANRYPSNFVSKLSQPGVYVKQGSSELSSGGLRARYNWRGDGRRACNTFRPNKHPQPISRKQI